MMSSSLFCVNNYSLFCKRCKRCLDDCFVYMYMSMGFCTEECRNEYFLEYRYRLAMAMEAKRWRTRSKGRKAPLVEGDTTVGYRHIFFICAEVESFP